MGALESHQPDLVAGTPGLGHLARDTPGLHLDVLRHLLDDEVRSQADGAATILRAARFGP